MVAYSFSERFVDLVERGVKTQTIRREGKKRHAREGEHVQIYTGLRTKSARKLITPDPICIVSTYCAVRPDGVTIGNLKPEFIGDIARQDGFRDWPDMLAWFCPDGLEFVGRLIRWERP